MIEFCNVNYNTVSRHEKATETNYWVGNKVPNGGGWTEYLRGWRRIHESVQRNALRPTWPDHCCTGESRELYRTPEGVWAMASQALLILSMIGSRGLMCSDFLFWKIPLAVAQRLSGFQIRGAKQWGGCSLPKERTVARPRMRAVEWKGGGYGSVSGQGQMGLADGLATGARKKKSPEWPLYGLMWFSKGVFCQIQIVYRTTSRAVYQNAKCLNW